MEPDVLCALQKAALFQALPASELRAIVSSSRVKVLRAGSSLWRKGDDATHLGLVLAGRLKVTRPGRREVLMDVAAPGSVLGEIAFVTGASYAHDVSCLRHARVLLVSRSSMRRALSASPGMALALATDLARQVLALTRMAEDLSAGDVEHRLACVLLRLADRAGEPFPGGILVPLKLRRADLAAMAATTVESTSRKIAAWQRLGWVIPQPAGYLIRNAPALRALTERA